MKYLNPNLCNWYNPKLKLIFQLPHADDVVVQIFMGKNFIWEFSPVIVNGGYVGRKKTHKYPSGGVIRHPQKTTPLGEKPFFFIHNSLTLRDIKSVHKKESLNNFLK